jgi:hypothetical protein
MEEQDESAQVERKESDADHGSDELPDPDREGPTPESEREELDDEDRSHPPDDLEQDPAYSPEGPEKGIKGG